MNEQDDTPLATLPLGDRTAKYLARDGQSYKWLLAFVIIGAVTIFSVVSLMQQGAGRVDCVNFHNPMNCTPKINRELYPADITYRDRGRAFLRMGRYDQAVVNLDEALRHNPADYESLFNRAEALFNLGKIDLADRDYETLAATSQYAVNALSRRADMFHEIGDDARAVIEITRAIDLSPTDDKLHLQRAISYMGMGSYDLALSDIGPILKLHPEYFDALRLSAHALLHIGRYPEAIQNFDQAIKAAPKNEPYPEIWYGRARAMLLSKTVLTSEEFGRILDDMKVASDEAKSDASWQNQICYDLALLDHATEALSYCDLGVTLNPEDGAVRDTRAYAYARLERWVDAIQDWDKALTLAPGTATYLFGRGFAHEQSGDIAAAAIDYAAARLADKNIDKLMHNLGISAGAEGISKGPQAGL